MLYSSHLADWRRQRERGELAGLSAKRGRKAEPVNPLAKRVAELEREKRRLERTLEQAELLLDIQKNRPRGLPRPIWVETSVGYTAATLGQWPLAFWRRMSP